MTIAFFLDDFLQVVHRQLARRWNSAEHLRSRLVVPLHASEIERRLGLGVEDEVNEPLLGLGCQHRGVDTL